MTSLDQADRITAEDLRPVWTALDPEERAEAFRLLTPEDGDDLFQGLSTLDQVEVLRALSPGERRLWVRALAPDDAADLLQEIPAEERQVWLDLLDESTRREVKVLLAYAEDEAGGLMSPRFARIRADMTVDEAIGYLRRQIQAHLETIYYAYILDQQQRLAGVVSLRELFASRGVVPVADVMHREVISVPENMDQEQVAGVFAEHDLVAIPVVDAEGRMKGIVTVDDIVDVVQEEATEDIQKIGGMQALDAPYLQTGFLPMLKKRAGWLAFLFVSGMLTTVTLDHFQAEIVQAGVLAVFMPLIIASGGNSGSQASTLVIRAMALGEVALRDWWRVVRREILFGVALGVILAVLGLVRIGLTQVVSGGYGPYQLVLALSVSLSLVGVVVWGTICGSMLPFALRRVGLDPASASAPFVATLVDVAGLLIYFSVARALLGNMPAG
ncbi:MAG: magnesium transporter [Phycisphaerae bacterium]|nr:MAG: magnesium transporter [Planctomycetota bacterium]KAB2939802.1 MAG: magnesium transporter [Phycisphaerae bacterium]MBE7455276.1 magnesium transporter [Planctomycetia bacterium]MCK6464089.1 magnesium transporter [Phycisphaerae bacterium]MCL4717738.1 magnesium transporter [Phycisphaerae bacterium]